eukprot:2845163-Prymnesium_polylepis.1
MLRTGRGVHPLNNLHAAVHEAVLEHDVVLEDQQWRRTILLCSPLVPQHSVRHAAAPLSRRHPDGRVGPLAGVVCRVERRVPCQPDDLHWRIVTHQCLEPRRGKARTAGGALHVPATVLALGEVDVHGLEGNALRGTF